jgi:hypothetical protein
MLQEQLTTAKMAERRRRSRNIIILAAIVLLCASGTYAYVNQFLLQTCKPCARIRFIISERLQKELKWQPLKPSKEVRLWTDDYCSPLSVLVRTFS